MHLPSPALAHPCNTASLVCVRWCIARVQDIVVTQTDRHMDIHMQRSPSVSCKHLLFRSSFGIPESSFVHREGSRYPGYILTRLVIFIIMTSVTEQPTACMLLVESSRSSTSRCAVWILLPCQQMVPCISQSKYYILNTMLTRHLSSHTTGMVSVSLAFLRPFPEPWSENPACSSELNFLHHFPSP